MAWVLSFICTFLPSTTTVLVWRLGFQTFLVWRCEKLTLLPYCLPLPVKSHFCIGVNCSVITPVSQRWPRQVGFIAILKDMIGSLDLTVILIMIVTIIVSLAVHEFMHAYVGHALGDTTARDEGRLTLNPLSHIDPFMTVLLPIITLVLFQAPILAAKPVPFNPERVKYDEFGAALIALAGPLSNFVLAFIAAVLDNFLAFGSALHEIATIFIYLNVAIGVFNLVPIPPLDGSRVLYAFAPESLQNFMRQIEPFGLILIFGLILTVGFGFLTNIMQFVLNLLP